jgi:methanogenic corrinoid protein MtbC1
VSAHHARASELADLLVESDQQAALELIEELHRAAYWTSPLFGTLFEPAARRLGDLWGEDLCTEFDVTLGLSRLQTAVRLLAAEEEPAVPFDGSQPVVLIVPEPGELHRLGATLDSRVLSIAGWEPHVELPADDKALQDIISASWFDVMDLSLSAAFRRDHWLPRVKETIRLARRASLNPGLMVLVGGRVFVEEKDALITAGADLASRTALNIDGLILQKMHWRNSP